VPCDESAAASSTRAMVVIDIRRMQSSVNVAALISLLRG
jgi:hypothetical protein